MKFRFNINITDEDYYRFNEFQALKTPFGKKQLLKSRIGSMLFLFAVVLLSVIVDGLTLEVILWRIPACIFIGVVVWLLPKAVMLMVKKQLKQMKKHGKPGYSPSSVVEFYDDCFAETTPENKTEQKYTAVENVFVVEGRVIYLFVNNIMAYIIPRSSFESVQQYNDFLNFIEAKCEQVKYC